MREEGEEEVRKIQTTESPWRKGGGVSSQLFSSQTPCRQSE